MWRGDEKVARGTGENEKLQGPRAARKGEEMRNFKTQNTKQERDRRNTQSRSKEREMKTELRTLACGWTSRNAKQT